MTTHSPTPAGPSPLVYSRGIPLLVPLHPTPGREEFLVQLYTPARCLGGRAAQLLSPPGHGKSSPGWVWPTRFGPIRWCAPRALADLRHSEFKEGRATTMASSRTQRLPAPI